MSLTEALMPTTHRLTKALLESGQEIDPNNRELQIAVRMTALEDMIEEKDWRSAHSLAISLTQELAVLRREQEADESGFVKPPRD